MQSKNIPPPYKHQAATTQFILNNDLCFVTSDPGTGKTRSCLDAIMHRVHTLGGRRTLVLAPLSILQPAWGDDCRKWTPKLTYSIAYAKNRQQAFLEPTDIVIMNHDGVKWLKENSELLKEFDTLIIDEVTAFKNRTSQRSKAIAKLTENFKYRIAMSGTLNSNGVLDTWHPAYLVDHGERLGNKFFNFRSQVCVPQQKFQFVEWVDKEDAIDTVATALKDITIRYKFEDCLDVPENTIRYIYTELPKAIRRLYEEFSENALLEMEQGELTAVHAGVKAKKLLQILSGAVYVDGEVAKVYPDRYQLVVELIKQAAHSVVAFNYKHERDEIIKLARKEKLRYAVIDGSVKQEARAKAVNEFQAGELDFILAHPQSAGHGLTLTKGVRTIWTSPTYNAEHFEQFNRRIYRAGQTQRTETILIAARDTKETEVYEALQGKLDRMDGLMNLFKLFTNTTEAA